MAAQLSGDVCQYIRLLVVCRPGDRYHYHSSFIWFKTLSGICTAVSGTRLFPFLLVCVGRRRPPLAEACSSWRVVLGRTKRQRSAIGGGWHWGGRRCATAHRISISIRSACTRGRRTLPSSVTRFLGARSGRHFPGTQGLPIVTYRCVVHFHNISFFNKQTGTA